MLGIVLRCVPSEPGCTLIISYSVFWVRRATSDIFNRGTTIWNRGICIIAATLGYLLCCKRLPTCRKQPNYSHARSVCARETEGGVRKVPKAAVCYAHTRVGNLGKAAFFDAHNFKQARSLAEIFAKWPCRTKTMFIATSVPSCDIQYSNVYIKSGH